MGIRTQLLLGFGVVFALMVVNAAVMYKSTNSLIESQDQVENTYQAVVLAGRLKTITMELQSTKRGFLISGEEAFQEPFAQARTAYRQEMERLKEIVADNRSQLQRLADVDQLVNRWIEAVAVPKIEARRKAQSADGTGTAIAGLIKEDETGRRLFREIHQKIEAFESGQQRQREEESKENSMLAHRSVWTVILGTLVAVILGTVIMLFTARTVRRQVGGEPALIAGIAEQIGKGNLDVQMEGEAEGATGIRSALGAMLKSLRENQERARKQDWLKTGVARLNEVMRGGPAIVDLAASVVSEITTYLDAQVGTFYVVNRETPPSLALMGSYAYKKRKNLSNGFAFGEGLVGQAALEKQQILVRNVPEDYITVTSGIGERVPTFICVTPFMYEGQVKGVTEIGTLHEMTDTQLEYLEQVMPALAIAVEASESRTRLTQALSEAQQLSEELQVQQEELRTTNEELEEHTLRLRESEEKLKVQQEELQVTNEELEERNGLLQRQKLEVERVKKEVEIKAREVAQASKYKSEFLSNMSHELRTPLNSLLLLAQSLAENKEETLTDDQVQSARIIHRSGSDLLNLINEILDLAKIEAGKMDLRLAPVQIIDFAEGIRSVFQPLAEQKGLRLEVIVDSEAPTEIVTDRKRMEQVIKNLVSNAIKFTQSGQVTVEYGRLNTATDTDLSLSKLDPERAVSIMVKDTGIGIAREHQGAIFEAFQQADGSTARKYGGTGLGLSISRELARLLGGEIQLDSTLGSGSTFTLFLPVSPTTGLSSGKNGLTARLNPGEAHPHVGVEGQVEAVVVQQIEDDRQGLGASDRVILIIEDDPNFAKILRDKCHERGLKSLVAATGEDGLDLAYKHLPHGILLDIRLPGMDGWSVLSALKDDTRTRHIPVHVVSVEEEAIESLRKGAVGHTTKPINREDLEQAFVRLEEFSKGTLKRVLVIEDDPIVRTRIVELVGNDDVMVDEVATAGEAIDAIRSTQYACAILDIGLPDMDGRDLLKKLQEERVEVPPIIVHTSRDLTPEEEMAVREHADSIVLKDVRSIERLLDEVSLFLHWMVSSLPEQKRQIITDLHETDALLREKKVLIVDDDMRTLFALSRLLADRGMQTLKAENGERALRLLDEVPDVDIVLTDIMMPVMDGFNTIKRIREQPRFHNLPVIALTAKAMPKDREDCMQAGANDYMTKPVDQDRLISMLRVWLYR